MLNAIYFVFVNYMIALAFYGCNIANNLLKIIFY